MTSYSPLLLPLTLAFCLSFSILAVALKSGITRYLAMDRPNQRSLHTLPVPRIGGIAIIVATLIAWNFTGGESRRVLMTVTVALAVVSYIDDWMGLPVLLRLAAHGMAAAVFAMLGLVDSVQNIWIAMGLVMYIVWMTNANNFMDGADGLAGGMALFGFSAYGLAACAAEAEAMAAISFSVAAAAGGFLLLNFPPAKVFMGDAGSIPLGFLAAVLGIMGWRQDLWPFWFSALVFSPFLVDASVTLVRRIWHGERFWQAHREHYYQRLIRMGWGHRRTALSEYLLMFSVAASAVLGLRLEPELQWSILAAWLMAFVCLMLAIDRRWQDFLRATNSGGNGG